MTKYLIALLHLVFLIVTAMYFSIAVYGAIWEDATSVSYIDEIGVTCVSQRRGLNYAISCIPGDYYHAQP